MTKNRKGLTARDSQTLTIRITAEQRRKLQAVAQSEGKTLGEVVRLLMLAGEVALQDPSGFARSFGAVARDQVLEDLGLGNERPVERIHAEILADRVRRFDKSAHGELDLV